ncbi:glutaredoxin family protein [Algibacillus agarilyticus]|uniref:glutaredoxin family protein n=1 Tax=Algibacillus agarilyticus TaxID=2234133 RepID=UPI000DD02B98|nr:glutaredoxin family protein [Algibacillus agarilyticus]
MKPYILYGTDGCHLCDLAFDECKILGITDLIERIDIVDSTELLAKYSLTIPVFRHVDKHIDLNWPFTATDLKALLDK